MIAQLLGLIGFATAIITLAVKLGEWREQRRRRRAEPARHPLEAAVRDVAVAIREAGLRG